MGAEITRPKYERRGSAYSSDLSDREWARIHGAPLVIAAIPDLFPWLRHLFADRAYSGDKLITADLRLGAPRCRPREIRY